MVNAMEERDEIGCGKEEKYAPNGYHWIAWGCKMNF